MKLCASSSGCETRPAKGEPARAGSPPGAGARHDTGEASACARVGHGACGPATSHLPGGPGCCMTCRLQRPRRDVGEERGVSGGVFEHGTDEEDGPGPGEALASPRPRPVQRRAGAPSPTHDPLACARVVGPSGTEQAPAAREAVGKGHQRHGRRRQGVGGLQRSVDVGEQGSPWNRPSQGGPCRGALRKGPMSNALTWHDRSPELRKRVGQESPRATSAAEPDAGNPLVRIW